MKALLDVLPVLQVKTFVKNAPHRAVNFLFGDNSKDDKYSNQTGSAEDIASNKYEAVDNSAQQPVSIRWLNLEQDIMCMLECGGYGTPQRNLICSKCRLLISADINAAKKSKLKFSQRKHNRIIEERLLKSLNDLPKSLAEEISKRTEDAIGEIFEIVPSLSAKSYAFEDISVRVQLLYEEIGELISRVAKSPSSKLNISVNEILRRVEECVCNRTYPILFCMSAAEKAAEVAHRDWIRSWKSMKHHCLPTEINFNSANFQAYMQDAGRALNEMNSFCTPKEKLDCIVRCVNCAYLATQENSDRSFSISPDVLVAVLIYTILHENPDLLQANLEFIGKFGQIHAVGYQGTGYSFTLICVAMHFVIDGIAETCLNRVREDFEKIHEEALLLNDGRLMVETGTVLPTQQELVSDKSAQTRVGDSSRFKPTPQHMPSAVDREFPKLAEFGKQKPYAADMGSTKKITGNSTATTAYEKPQISQKYGTHEPPVSKSHEVKNAEFAIRSVPLTEQKFVIPKTEFSNKTITENYKSKVSASEETKVKPLETSSLSEDSKTSAAVNKLNSLTSVEGITKDASQVGVEAVKISSKLAESTARPKEKAAMQRQYENQGSAALVPPPTPDNKFDTSKAQEKLVAAKDVATAIKMPPVMKGSSIMKKTYSESEDVPDSGAQNLALSSTKTDNSSSKKLHNSSITNEKLKDPVVYREVASTKTPAKFVESATMSKSDALSTEKQVIVDSRERNESKISSRKHDELSKVEFEAKRDDGKKPEENAEQVAATDAKTRQFIRIPSLRFPPPAPPTWTVAPPDRSTGSLKTIALTTAKPMAATAVTITSTAPTTNPTAVATLMTAGQALPSPAESLPSWRPIAMRKDSGNNLEKQDNSPTHAFAREFLTTPKNLTQIAQDRDRLEISTTAQAQSRFVSEDLAGIDPKLLLEQALKFSEARIAQEKLRKTEQVSKSESNPNQSSDSSKGMMEYLLTTQDSPAKKTRIIIKADNTNDITNGKEMSPKEALLRWCQIKTKSYPINISNFSGSWADGMAFCALVHHFRPTAFDFSKLQPQDRRNNLELGFRVAEQHGIDRLLEVEDMILMGDKPDWKCVFTYVQAIYRRFRNEN
uniref:Calponin-homology (CH) domain-containing protein n=1 Tax=Plectus sambesii TaxID=2011161 RepID=A0A914WVQ2_9BILA